MWFPDLSPYSYMKVRAIGAASASTLNVGWLERGHPFPSGAISSDSVERVHLLVEHGAMNATRGIHFCDLCPPAEHSASSVVSARARGNAEIRVVGADGTRYAAPTLLHHYVLVHGYGPPQEFVDALMRSAHVAWATAKAEDLCLGCGSPMRRTGSAPATYGGERVTCVSLDCETCGTSYQRRWPSE